MERRSITWSVTFHVVVMGLIAFGIPGLGQRPYDVPESIPVEMVFTTVNSKTNVMLGKDDDPSPNKGNQPIKEVQKPEPPPPPAPPKPKEAPPMSVPKPPDAKPDVPDAREPEKVEVAEAEKPVEKPVKPDEKPVKPVEKPAKPKKPVATGQDVSDILKNLRKVQDTLDDANANYDAQKAKPAQGSANGQSRGGAVLSVAYGDAVAQKIKPCWFIDPGIPNFEQMVVAIRVEIDPTGVVRTAVIADESLSRAQYDPYYRAAAESARRAALMPQCQPLPLPMDRYDEWHNMTIEFNPMTMLR